MNNGGLSLSGDIPGGPKSVGNQIALNNLSPYTAADPNHWLQYIDISCFFSSKIFRKESLVGRSIMYTLRISELVSR